MKTYIPLLTVLAFVMSACHSSRNAIPLTPIIVNNTDSVRTEYIEKVRIDTLIITVPVPAESALQTVKDSTSHVETSLAESDAWINPDGTLGHYIRNKDTALNAEALISVKETQTNNKSEKIREVPVQYPEPVYIEREFTKWESFRLNAFWYIFSIAIAGIVWIFRKILIKVFLK